MQRNSVRRQEQAVQETARRAAMTPADQAAPSVDAAAASPAGTVDATTGQLRLFGLLGITTLADFRLG